MYLLWGCELRDLQKADRMISGRVGIENQAFLISNPVYPQNINETCKSISEANLSASAGTLNEFLGDL